MQSRIKLSKKNLVQMVSNYDLGVLSNTKTFTLGSVQTNILLLTTRGKFVLRCYKGRTKGSVMSEIGLTNYLKKHGFPAPGVIENKQRSSVSIYDDKLYVILEFVEGEHVKKPEKIIAIINLGEALMSASSTR
jgi:Ser/Thr protein kinase RdoA (MazF antagonist)